MVLQDWKPSPLWQIKDQSWTASILFQGFGKHNYQFKDIILKVICEFSDCVFGHPLWKRNSVIYFLVEQSWTWINIWSIHYDQLSGGVLEAALQIPFNQITNTQQIWFILLGSFSLIYIIIGYQYWRVLSSFLFWWLYSWNNWKYCCHLLAGRWQAWGIRVFPSLHLDYTGSNMSPTPTCPELHAYTSSLFAFQWQS